MPVKKYQVVNGTHYDERTPKAVIDALEKARREGTRIEIHYVWESGTRERGTVSRSTGPEPIPILIRTTRSLGGEAIMDHCILKITETKTGRLLYRHE